MLEGATSSEDPSMEPDTGTPTQTNPPPAANATAMPERTAHLLSILDLLLEYGRHIADTLRCRAAAPHFAFIARGFSNTQLAVILLHLYRGIMRARALRSVLLARAARGRDIAAPVSRYYVVGGPDDPAQQPASAPSEPGPAPDQPAARRPARKAAAAEPLRQFSQLPSMEELEADARRRPTGQVMIDICLDLGVVPGLCHARFWSELWNVIIWYDGNGARYYREIDARRDRFNNEYGRPREPDGSEPGRAMRRVLGFFIGEVPVNPHAPPPDLPPPELRAPDARVPDVPVPPGGRPPPAAEADRPP